MKAAMIMHVNAIKNRTSKILVNTAERAGLCERSAQKIRYVHKRNIAAHRPKMSSIMETEACFLSKVFIRATTVMHRPASPPEVESRLSNSSRRQFLADCC